MKSLHKLVTPPPPASLWDAAQHFRAYVDINITREGDEKPSLENNNNNIARGEHISFGDNNYNIRRFLPSHRSIRGV